jgi:hypothetical protein
MKEDLEIQLSINELYKGSMKALLTLCSGTPLRLLTTGDEGGSGDVAQCHSGPKDVSQRHDSW